MLPYVPNIHNPSKLLLNFERSPTSHRYLQPQAHSNNPSPNQQLPLNGHLYNNRGIVPFRNLNAPSSQQVQTEPNLSWVPEIQRSAVRNSPVDRGFGFGYGSPVSQPLIDLKQRAPSIGTNIYTKRNFEQENQSMVSDYPQNINPSAVNPKTPATMKHHTIKISKYQNSVSPRANTDVYRQAAHQVLHTSGDLTNGSYDIPNNGAVPLMRRELSFQSRAQQAMYPRVDTRIKTEPYQQEYQQENNRDYMLLAASRKLLKNLGTIAQSIGDIETLAQAHKPQQVPSMVLPRVNTNHLINNGFGPRRVSRLGMHQATVKVTNPPEINRDIDTSIMNGSNPESTENRAESKRKPQDAIQIITNSSRNNLQSVANDKISLYSPSCDLVDSAYVSDKEVQKLRSSSEVKKKKKTKKTILKRAKSRAQTTVIPQTNGDSDTKKVVTFLTQEKKKTVQSGLRKKWVDERKADIHKTFLEDYAKAKQAFIDFAKDHLKKPLMKLYKDVTKLKIASSQAKEAELNKRCRVVHEHTVAILEELISCLTSRKLPTQIRDFLVVTSQEGMSFPNHHLTEYEIKRLDITNYTTLKNTTRTRSKMMIASHLLIRMLLCEVIMKPGQIFPEFNNKKAKMNFENLLTISSLIYNTLLDIFERDLKAIKNNQASLKPSDRLKPCHELIRATDIHDGHLGDGLLTTTDDISTNIIAGFFSRQNMIPLIRDRPVLYADVKDGLDEILDKLCEDVSKEYTENVQKYRQFFL